MKLKEVNNNEGIFRVGRKIFNPYIANYRLCNLEVKLEKTRVPFMGKTKNNNGRLLGCRPY